MKNSAQALRNLRIEDFLIELIISVTSNRHISANLQLYFHLMIPLSPMIKRLTTGL